jgi:hypothetical protein
MKSSTLAAIKANVTRRTAFLNQEADLEERRSAAFELVEEQQAKVDAIRAKLDIAEAALHEYQNVFHAIAEEHDAAGGYEHYYENKAAKTNEIITSETVKGLRFLPNR